MPPSLLPPTPEELEELRLRRRASQLKGYGEGVEDPTAQALLNVRRNLGEAGRAVVGAKPYDETNPTGSYRAVQALMNAPTPAAIIPEAAQAAGKAATALSGLGALGVVKPKGGNWLAGTVERGLKTFKNEPIISGELIDAASGRELFKEYQQSYKKDPTVGLVEWTRKNHPEVYDDLLRPGEAAINNWIDTKLSKYVKNEMATPEDPVRALAERGVLHVDPETLNQYKPTHTAFEREMAGFPPEGLAQSPGAQRWEDITDYLTESDTAGNLLDPSQYGKGFVEKILETNPWLAKVDPETPVYGVDSLAYRVDYEEAGFRHLIDELMNATDPDSGLPRALQLSPDKLQKVTVPQAVELVDKINKWRAEQKAAADLKRSQNAATVEYKAYETIPGTTEPNQRGLRWVELKKPEGANPAYLGGGKYEDPAMQFLADALKYEGEVMGHCVGGYCPDVAEGRSRIYSLRDAKGEPHVTIEVEPGRLSGKTSLEDWAQTYEKTHGAGTSAEFLANHPEIAEAFVPTIKQIKGKANRAPKDEYLPFVQDFVRSGQWSKVGDMQNTGMRSARDVFSEGELNMLRQAGQDVPPALSGEDIQRLHNLIVPEGRRLKYNARGQVIGSEDPNYAAGGAVRMNEGGKPPKRRASDLPGYGEGSAADMLPAPLLEAARAIVGAGPSEPTNPSEVYRIAQTLANMSGVAGAVGAVKRPAGAAAALRELLRTEAPAQSAAAREALRRAYRTGHEHSVVGLTEAGVPGEVVTSGNRTRVIPSAADVSRAVSDPQRRAIVDFHTHPSDVSGLRVSPSADDVAFYADYERGAWPRTLKTFIASPPSTGGGRASTAYSFFETDVPRRVYDKDLFEKAELELQNAGRLGRFDRVRRDPAFAAAFESGAVDLQDLLGEAAPLLLLERRAAQGAGRQRLDLGANAVAPNAELRDFYEMIREPAQEFLKKNKLKKGGAVKIETNPTLMADELLFKGYRR